MPMIYIHTADDGTIERVHVADKGRGIAAEVKPEEWPTAAAAPVVAWALAHLATARASVLRDALAKLGGVPAEKLDAAVAAIESTKAGVAEPK